MSLHTIKTEQRIPAELDEIWDFISSPANLKNIAPEYMGFEITTKDVPAKMYPGAIICYKVRPVLNLPMTWVTEITHVEDKKYFVDEQRKGPYKMWHHEHHIEPIPGGVLMTDIVSYIPPMGVLGDLANAAFISRQLDEIFSFRRKRLTEIFGQWPGK